MALGLLGLMFLSIMILSTASLVILLYQKGQYVQRDWAFMLIQVYVVLLAGMKITVGSSNDLLGQIIGYGIFAAAISPLFFKKRYFTQARMLLVGLVIVAPLCILL